MTTTPNIDRQVKILSGIKAAWEGELARAKKPTAVEFAVLQIAAYDAKIAALIASR